MFYVVFLNDFARNIVIPCSWIRDEAQMMRKFVNSGINSAQTHWCYFNSTMAAQIERNGKMVPNGTVTPDFSIPQSEEFPCDEGIFKCRVLAFYGEYGCE